jgi:RNA polymerase sigma factor (sigma-70 family)
MDFDTLLPAIVAGDADAFGRFIAGIEIDLRRSLRPFAARVDIEAVLQEALLRVWQSAARIVPDGRPQALVRFSMRVARNLAISEIRKKRELLPGDDEVAEAFDDAEVAPPDPMLRRLIHDCFEKLPPQPKMVLGMRLENRGAEPDLKLAEEAGMKLNTFLQNVTRARKLLGECLEHKGVTFIGGAP